MGYQHSLNASIQFKAPITVKDAIVLLQPLANTFGWTEHQITNPEEQCDETVILLRDGTNVLGIELHTEGEVVDDFGDSVERFAASLSDLAKPDYLDLRNYDSGKLDSAIEHLWYGSQDEVAQAKSDNNRSLAMQHLEEGGVEPCMIVAIDTFIQEGKGAIELPSAQALAGRFWQELLATHENLHEISVRYGPETLANLFYLYVAINNCSYVEFCDHERSAVAVARALPSGRQWLHYITVT